MAHCRGGGQNLNDVQPILAISRQLFAQARHVARQASIPDMPAHDFAHASQMSAHNRHKATWYAEPRAMKSAVVAQICAQSSMTRMCGVNAAFGQAKSCRHRKTDDVALQAFVDACLHHRIHADRGGRGCSRRRNRASGQHNRAKTCRNRATIKVDLALFHVVLHRPSHVFVGASVAQAKR